MSVFTPLLVMCQAYLNCVVAIPPAEMRSYPTEVACIKFHTEAFPLFIGTAERLDAFKKIPWANFVCRDDSLT
jgi:hypothetical protein